MNTVIWYLVALGAFIMVVLLVAGLAKFAPRNITIIGTKFFRHTLCYLALYFFVVFVIVNLLYLAFGIGDKASFGQRCARAAIFNFIPLSAGGDMNPLANTLHLRLDTYARAHRWIGRVAIFEGFTHVVVASIQHQPDMHVLSNVAGLVVSVFPIEMNAAQFVQAVTILTLMLCSLLLRRKAFEIFLTSHWLLAVILIIANLIHIHVSTQTILLVPNIFLLMAICIHSLIALLRLCFIIFRNLSAGSWRNEASVDTCVFAHNVGNDVANIVCADAAHVLIRLVRPWDYKPGQYVYLRVGTQSHPFYFFKCDTKEDENFIILLIQRRNGFTKHILGADKYLENINEKSTKGQAIQKVIIEGPYGHGAKLDEYDKVLFFATGVGISGELAYIEGLLPEVSVGKVTQVVVFWEIETEIQSSWTANHMNKLIKKDKFQVLKLYLFIIKPINPEKKGKSEIKGRSGLHNVFFTRMDIDHCLMEIGENNQVALFLATDQSMNRKIRKKASKLGFRSSDIYELEFYPSVNKLKNRSHEGYGHKCL
ncbi:uncharacterized protein PV09_09595 [Verruconis gallopava]|uniref:ferric-chelate reductase (NADPH) n=1 Tax=Verruconis gallopava TaxID=253628 RepID=A0A0D1ZX49_9PEZI|nr:uncharacterized protein PV09_09595 [Verruconis gallopava]KIV98619.1 hypothetical protein PV09_09595 [Verruconis gallopava]